MRFLIVLVAAPAFAAQGFIVVGPNPEPWQTLLLAAGLKAVPLEAAQVAVLRPGAAASSTNWDAWVRQGRHLILEGPSPVAEQFGIRASTTRVSLRREVYRHDPGALVIWPGVVEILAPQLPAQAVVYSKDRWTDTALMAGQRVGAGGVLWVALDPGTNGYDRYPYLIQALQDLGLDLRFRSRRLWAFFDYAYRTRVDLNYMARRWREMGLAGLYVSAWHFWERNAERDAYLERLIRACHQNGVLVYAWTEFPHVSDKFWDDHPQWREKNALLQDALVFWRKNINLLNRDASREVMNGMRDLLLRFEWDGVNFAELYFESTKGIADLPEFTPFSDDVRNEVRARHGFDPAELFRQGSPQHYAANPDLLRKFYDYRVELQYRLHLEWIDFILGLRSIRPGLALTLTYVDDLFDRSLRDNIGADVAGMLKLMETRDFEFMSEDPSTIWHLGPERYTEIARLYREKTTLTDRLAIDINIARRPQLSFPTLTQAGSEIARLVRVSSEAFQKVALYFEASIVDFDTPLLPPASALVDTFEETGTRTRIKSPYGVGLRYAGDALVGGKLWPYADAGTLWLPPGEHVIEPSSQKPAIRLLDFNGGLVSAEIAGTALRVQYKGNARALAVVDREPKTVRLNGRDSGLRFLEYKGRYSIVLPPGENTLEIEPYEVAGTPSVNAGGTVNGASFAAGLPIAPGMIASIFGTNLATSTAQAASTPLPLRLAETTVRINDSPTPLFYASPAQLNVQVPWDLAGFLEAPVVATVNGVSAPAQTARVAAFSPGVFVTSGTQGAILVAGSGRLADANRPARRSESVEIYCTGLGNVSNTPVAGTVALSNPLSTTLTAPTVTVGGALAEVTFAGLAPGFVGVYQVNARIPAGAAAGGSVPVVVTIGGVSSNTATIAVE